MKLKAALPKNDYDGLSPAEHRIERLQQTETVVVAVLHTESRIEDLETGDFELVLNIRRIEALVDPNDERLARLLLTKRFEKRTGVTRLPINDDKSFKDEFYETVRARGWRVDEDGTITIPFGTQSPVDELPDHDAATGEVLDDNPVEDQPARAARKGPKR